MKRSSRFTTRGTPTVKNFISIVPMSHSSDQKDVHYNSIRLPSWISCRSLCEPGVCRDDPVCPTERCTGTRPIEIGLTCSRVVSIRYFFHFMDLYSVIPYHPWHRLTSNVRERIFISVSQKNCDTIGLFRVNPLPKESTRGKTFKIKVRRQYLRDVTKCWSP